MNYKSIHDIIIDRAKNRINDTTILLESHHIIPKCEGGHVDGEQVLLTQKEHRLIHKLRYKITGVLGNYLAYNLMRYGHAKKTEMQKYSSQIDGKAHHQTWKNKDFEGYIERQRNAGLIGGVICKNNNLGFFNMNEEDKQRARKKGTETIVKNKLGMFSDEYRVLHKLSLQKKVHTPDGAFDSLTAAAKHYGISRSSMTYRVNSSNFTEWYLIDKGEV